MIFFGLLIFYGVQVFFGMLATESVLLFFMFNLLVELHTRIVSSVIVRLLVNIYR